MLTRPQSPAVMRVIVRLQSLGKSTERTSEAWLCQCPAHTDECPSFAVTGDDQDGKALMVCRAGCSQAEVIEALGIHAKDLFLTQGELKAWRGEGGVYSPETPSSTSSPEEINSKRGILGAELGTDLKNASSSVSSSEGEAVGLTVDEYAEAKRLPKEFLQRLGLTTVYLSGMPVVSTPYKDAEGIVHAVQFRRALAKGAHEDGRFFWSRKGTKPLLYGLWRTESLSQTKDITLVEGASDCQTLWLHDLPAIGLPGADSWREEWASTLEPIPVGRTV